MKTPNQFLSDFKHMVRGWFDEWIRKEEMRNADMWAFGVVNAVNGTKADVYINGASSVTPSVPIAPHVGTLAVNDKVLILNRAQMRDLMILSKTLQ